MDNDKLAALDKAATQGVWEVDSERDDDASYGSGPDHGVGFHNYFIGANVNGKWRTLLDTVNSEHKMVEEEYDEDSHHAWDAIGKANTAFATTLVNAYRAGELVPVSLDADTAGLVERLGVWGRSEFGQSPPGYLFTEAATALRTITAERDALAKRVGDMRVQGQREGGRAVLSWLRERSAHIPPASLWHAAEQLADQYEATQSPACATLKGTDA